MATCVSWRTCCTALWRSATAVLVLSWPTPSEVAVPANLQDYLDLRERTHLVKGADGAQLQSHSSSSPAGLSLRQILPYCTAEHCNTGG
jgi:hypothetical protein